MINQQDSMKDRKKEKTFFKNTKKQLKNQIPYIK